MNDWLVLAIVYLIVFISSPLIAILHELGHAFAYLLFTKPDRIDIYIGSYGDSKNQIRFRIGKLYFFIKRSFPIVKGIGLCCSYKAESNYIYEIIILLAGALFTLITAGIMAFAGFRTNAGFLVQMSCYIFLGFSALSLLSNLIPDKIRSANNLKLDNDGKQILFVLKIKGLLPQYNEALFLFKKGDHNLAIEKLDHILQNTGKNRKILTLLITKTLLAKKWDKAAFYLEKLESQFKLTANDMVQRGCLQSFTKQHDQAIQTYGEVLKQDKTNLIALNNIGYELIEKGAHQVALRALERAIKLSPQFDHPYQNLGY